jgi:hypothetical protein
MCFFFPSVIPANAGIQGKNNLDPGSFIPGLIRDRGDKNKENRGGGNLL